MFEEFQWRPEQPQFPNRIDSVEAALFLKSALAMKGKLPHELVLDGALHYLSEGKPGSLIGDPDEMSPTEMEALCTLLDSIKQQFDELSEEQSPKNNCLLLHQDSYVIRKDGVAEVAVVFRIRDTNVGKSFQAQPTEYLLSDEAIYALPGHPTLMTASADLEDPEVFCLEAHFSKAGLAAMQRSFVESLETDDAIWQQTFIGQRLLENFPTPETGYQDPALAAATAVESISLVHHRNSKLHLRLETHEHGPVLAIVHIGRFYKNLEIEFAIDPPPAP
jgi:hypothetical protein